MDTESTIRADVVLAEMRAGFNGIHREMADIKADQMRMHADNRADQNRMHAETSDRLDLINGKVARAHERLSEHDGLISAMTRRVGEIADGVHKKFNDLWVSLEARFERLQEGDGDDFAKSHVTVGALWKIITAVVTAVVATVLATYGFMLANGWHRGTP